jgi:hypothetical protein
MIAELEKHIEDTNKIKNNEPVDEFRIERVGVWSSEETKGNKG